MLEENKKRNSRGNAKSEKKKLHGELKTHVKPMEVPIKPQRDGVLWRTHSGAQDKSEKAGVAEKNSYFNGQ